MIRLTLIAASLVWAAPAASKSQADDRFAMARLHDYARCAIDARELPMRELLRSDYRAKDYDGRMRSEIARSNRCLNFGKLQFSMMLFAGAVAERLVERDVLQIAEMLRRPIDPASAPLVAYSEADVMALCTVRAEPEIAASLLASEPMSVAEKDVAGALMPSLKRCLVAGANVKLNTPAVRALVALAAWRLADHGTQFANTTKGSR